jgi:hypothetical protein
MMAKNLFMIESLWKLYSHSQDCFQSLSGLTRRCGSL